MLSEGVASGYQVVAWVRPRGAARDGLIGGKLYGKAVQRTGQSGKPFTTAKVRAAAGDADALFINVITFSETAGAALLALDEGDSVALSGTLTPKVWTDKNGETRPALDMVANVVLTAYHVNRKRQAVSESSRAENGGGSAGTKGVQR